MGLVNFTKFNKIRMIRESFTYFVEDFLDLVKSIDHPISKDILGLNRVYIEDSLYNCIRLSEDPGYIEYLNNNTMRSSFINRFGGDFNDGILPINKFNDWYNDNLILKNFSRMKIGRLIGILFPGKWDSTQVEKFTDLFKSKFGSDYEFQIVNGESIRFWYNEENYSKWGGKLSSTELGKSCMRYSHKEDYLDIYVDNPEVVEMLILKQGDYLIGRALIWTTDSGEILMDRVYSVGGHIYQKFEEYRSDNSWGLSYNGQHSVKLGKCDYEYYPYMDSFFRLDTHTRHLYNYTINPQDMSGQYELLSQYGDDFEIYPEYNWSEYYGKWIVDRDSYWSEKMGDWIDIDDKVRVSIGSQENKGFYPTDYEHIHKIEWGSKAGKWAHEDDLIWSDINNSFILKSDAVDSVVEIRGFIPIIEELSTDVNYLRTQDINKESSWFREVSKKIPQWNKADCFNHTAGVYGGVPLTFSINVYPQKYDDSVRISLEDSINLGIEINENMVYVSNIFDYCRFFEDEFMKRGDYKSYLEGESIKSPDWLVKMIDWEAGKF